MGLGERPSIPFSLSCWRPAWLRPSASPSWTKAQMAKAAERPTSWELLFSWLRVSLQSFGGGTATLALIRQEFVTKHEWITEERFLRDWSLCQLAPGINLVALSILIGKRTRGGLGVLISLSGLLLPSFLLTVLLTAAYSRYLHTPVVNNAL